MIQKVFDYVEQNNMLMPQDVVAAGVSGGADSVCLLFLLTCLRKRIPFSLIAVHVNHGIRKEADSDEAYVKELCEKWQVPFFAVRGDVAALARKQGISEEEAGRNLRYNSFNEILSRVAPAELASGKAKIAVAHNQNDRAETMLFNLIRGTGIQGLCSIQPVRNTIIRPLLCLTRAEIEQILYSENIAYCIDCTNAEDTYTRNKIRNKIFPYIIDNISPTVIEKMNHAADLLTEARDYIKDETDNALKRLDARRPDDKRIVINVQALLREAPFLQGQLIIKAIEAVYPGKKDITSAHVQTIKDLCRKTGSKQINLPYGILIKKEYDDLYFILTGEDVGTNSETAAENVMSEAGTESIEVNQIPGNYVIYDIAGKCLRLDFKVLPYKKDEQIPQNKYTKWFDYDKIDKSLFIRKRRSGDYLTINGQLSHKSLKEYLIEEKIPKDKRDNLWILAEENHVLWVIGHRISTKYKISENTNRILQVQLIGGESWQNM